MLICPPKNSLSIVKRSGGLRKALFCPTFSTSFDLRNEVDERERKRRIKMGMECKLVWLCMSGTRQRDDPVQAMPTTLNSAEVRSDQVAAG